MATSWIRIKNCSSIFLLLFLSILRSYSVSGNQACSAVRADYTKKGYDRDDVPPKMVSGEHLQICPIGFTCCTQTMETNLNKESRHDFDKIMGDKISLVRQLFITRTTRFDTFFTDLLDQSKKDLHNMFVKTYGLLYQQNSKVFTDLYDDLRAYYTGADINLMDALDNFFSTLLQRMFELLNSGYQFDQNYLLCVSERMDELKPFGDIPSKLSVQVRRAFVAARTFVKGLSVGRDVTISVSRIQPTGSCQKAVMKLLYCPYCKGMPETKPCNTYCMNVMKGCMAYHADLNEEWNKYIESLMKLAERLEGPFNIESVVDPIDVKISEAIMNFQENSETVSQKVFSVCGEPQYNRKKREANPKQQDDEFKFSFPYDWKDSRVRPTTAAGTNLDRLVRDIKEKVKVVKDVWKGLPDSFCNEVAAGVDEQSNCWNGLGKGRYAPQMMGDGVYSQNNNPEVDVNIRKPNSIINQQILQLKIITNKLDGAYTGYDVSYGDYAHEDGARGSGHYHDGSGSGMDDQSGSGYDPPHRNGVRDDERYPIRTGTPPGYVHASRSPPGSYYDDQSSSQHLRPSFVLFGVSMVIAALLSVMRH